LIPDDAQLDRAIGTVVASAVGDALGAQYEFGPARPEDWTPEFGANPGHALGEWTDDTAMAFPILDALARGESLNHPSVLGRIVAEWADWSLTALDVGAQTRAVLELMAGDYSEERALRAAMTHHTAAGRSAGNGSLMRTGPAALGYLADGRERELVDAVGRIAQLTHWEQDNVDACLLWSLMIRHAIRTGELDPFGPLEWLEPGRRRPWEALIRGAIDPARHPRDFGEQNRWVVRAFEGALSAVAGAADIIDALHRAIRGGGDTDTIAAIAGALAGARWGATQVPQAWRDLVHGWPGIGTHDLARLAALAVRGGEPDRDRD